MLNAARHILKNNGIVVSVMILLLVWNGWRSYKYEKFVAKNYTLEVVGDLGTCIPCVAKQVVATRIKSVGLPVVVDLEFEGDIIFDLGWPHAKLALFGRGYESAGSIKISIPEDVVADGNRLIVNLKAENLPEEIREVCL